MFVIIINIVDLRVKNRTAVLLIFSFIFHYSNTVSEESISHCESLQSSMLLTNPKIICKQEIIGTVHGSTYIIMKNIQEEGS